MVLFELELKRFQDFPGPYRFFDVYDHKSVKRSGEGRVMIRKLVLAAGLAGGLTGCQAGPGKVADVHTGQTISYSSRVSISSGLLSNLHGRAYYSTRKGYGVAIDYLATGTGWAHFSAVYSYGKQLPYVRGPSNVLGCGGGCSITETGEIKFTEAEFAEAAKRGFDFALIGQNGRIDSKMPASAFQEVLRQK